MRRDHNVAEAKQRRVGYWLFGEHIKCRTSDCAVAQSFGEVGFVGDAAASNVDNAQRTLCALQHVGVDDARGLFVFW